MDSLAPSGGNGVVSPTETTAATSSQDPKNLDETINSIQKSLGLLHQLNLTVSSFNLASQPRLLQRLNNLVLELDNMSKLPEKCNIDVPMEVFNLIDDGKNPDEFTRDVLNKCIAKNQITKGMADALKDIWQYEYQAKEYASKQASHYNLLEPYFPRLQALHTTYPDSSTRAQIYHCLHLYWHSCSS
ncbi:mediator of RNA polymerase II transcription subunit 10b-like isoform X1 [Daucus carota subsp. sativus]|uniref:mediator of RNA polymerase II transcription subunit 10b-like isoform X1 n=1 Tax=Daucus carota subsp. sativus TaxID=79200 RepID=UPI0007F00DB4|nr:PREDICTED: mediator of RNA polymerase II transcription subunit 10b-like isoform X1 [Daucus carota subsp. sativus]